MKSEITPFHDWITKLFSEENKVPDHLLSEGKELVSPNYFS